MITLKITGCEKCPFAYAPHPGVSDICNITERSESVIPHKQVFKDDNKDIKGKLYTSQWREYKDLYPKWCPLPISIVLKGS